MKKTLSLSPLSVDTVNSVLPQTQCELCTYKGCKPYAEAIVNDGERIDRCHPGGERVLNALAELTNQDAESMRQTVIDQQPPLMVAIIREDECIGCKKCIQACPVDAIIGSGKMMHTVLADECSGCELCVPPCPVDCIDMITIDDANTLSDELFEKRANQFRTRYEAREKRLIKKKKEQRQKHLSAKQASSSITDIITERKKLIAASIARSKKPKR